MGLEITSEQIFFLNENVNNSGGTQDLSVGSFLMKHANFPLHVALRSCQLKRAFPRISGPLNNTLHDVVIGMKHMLCTAASICAIDLLQNTSQLRILYW